MAERILLPARARHKLGLTVALSTCRHVYRGPARHCVITRMQCVCSPAVAAYVERTQSLSSHKPFIGFWQPRKAGLTLELTLSKNAVT